MIDTLIPFIVSILISLILYVFTKKKWLVVVCCCAMMVMSSAIIYINDKNISVYEDFYLPFLDYPINYDMTRADVLNLLSANKEEVLYVDENNIVIEKDWLGVVACVFFCFDDTTKLEEVSWGQAITENCYLTNEQIESLYNDIVDYFDSCYGRSKFSQDDLSYYWENTYHYKITFLCLKDFFMVYWYKPDRNPITIHIDEGR